MAGRLCDSLQAISLLSFSLDCRVQGLECRRGEAPFQSRGCGLRKRAKGGDGGRRRLRDKEDAGQHPGTGNELLIRGSLVHSGKAKSDGNQETDLVSLPRIGAFSRLVVNRGFAA